MVVCTVPDEQALRLLAAQTSRQNIRQYTFEEEDLDNQGTAFATEPIQGEARKFFKKLPLWEPEVCEAIA